MKFIAIYFAEDYSDPIERLKWLYDMAEYRDSKYKKEKPKMKNQKDKEE